MQLDRVIADPRVVGVGMAETSERLVDHGFAGRRAMEEALMKTHSALQQIKLEKMEISVNRLP
jgi:hypothetical protein